MAHTQRSAALTVGLLHGDQIVSSTRLVVLVSESWFHISALKDTKVTCTCKLSIVSNAVTIKYTTSVVDVYLRLHSILATPQYESSKLATLKYKTLTAMPWAYKSVIPRSQGRLCPLVLNASCPQCTYIPYRPDYCGITRTYICHISSQSSSKT